MEQKQEIASTVVTSKNGNANPFASPKDVTPRPRLFLWGPPGAGKTRSALSLGRCAYISLERGAQYYAQEFNFDQQEPTTFEAILESVRWLAKNEHTYQTVIVDPITIAWDMVQTEFLAKKREKLHNPMAIITGGDWKDIKPRYNALLKLLTLLDMNVVVIARSTKNYVDSDDEMLKVDRLDPETFQAEKSTAYIMDTEIQLRAQRKGGKLVFIGYTRKDRSGKLPAEPFEFTQENIRKYFGAIVDQSSKPVTLTADLDSDPNCEVCGKPIEPAGGYDAKKVAASAKVKFGQAMCFACRQNRKEGSGKTNDSDNAQ